MQDAEYKKNYSENGRVHGFVNVVKEGHLVFLFGWVRECLPLITHTRTTAFKGPVTRVT